MEIRAFPSKHSAASVPIKKAKKKETLITIGIEENRVTQKWNCEEEEKVLITSSVKNKWQSFAFTTQFRQVTFLNTINFKLRFEGKWDLLPKVSHCVLLKFHMTANTQFFVDWISTKIRIEIDWLKVIEKFAP